jgi:Hint domain
MTSKTLTGSYASYVISTDSYTLTNLGTIGSSTVSNGLTATGAADSVVNTGIILGGNNAVAASDGLSLTNQSGAIISGGNQGVYIAGSPGAVINEGSISAKNGAGIVLNAGGVVRNLDSGAVAGYTFGVAFQGATGTLVNAGTIDSYKDGVFVRAGGAITNQAGGTIIATYGRGIRGITAAVAVVNAGSIAAYTEGVYLAAGGSVTNQIGGTIGQRGTVQSGAPNSFKGAVVSFNPNVTVENSGAISGQFFGVYLGAGGVVTNQAGGVVTGAASTGILVKAGTGTVVNAGSVAGAIGGIALYSGVNASNASTGVVIATGSFGSEGFSLAPTDTLDNAGSVSAGDAGVVLAGGSALTNESTGTISQSGGYALNNHFVGVFLSSGGATLINAGSISGQNYGVDILNGSTVINRTGGWIGSGTNIGAYVANGGTLINAGSITGGAYAVQLKPRHPTDSGTARLVVDSGAIFNGAVSGGSTIGYPFVGVLELASSSSDGTLSGLGTQFINFASIAIDPSAVWTLAASSTIASGAALSELANASLISAGTLVNNGSIVLGPSTMIDANLSGVGSVTLDAGSTLEVQATLAGGETIRFAGGGAYLHLDTPGSAHGGVTNLELGSTIDLTGINPAFVSYNSGTLEFTGGSFPLELAAGNTLQVNASVDGAELTALCFVTGTMILTPSGERRVQDLAAGNLVTTASGAVRPISWIGAGKVLATRGQRNAATPVIVRRGALAPNVPARDLHVTKGHCLYINDVLIPVAFLVNHRSIIWDDRAQEVELYHVELETHDVLIADGAPAESYRDDGNRWLFRNANAGWDLPAQEPCAPILTGGPIVDVAWRRLLDCAGPRPGLPLTTDADLHLIVDGERVDQEMCFGGVVTFRLARRPRSVQIVSRAAAPDQLGIARDPRELGVALRRITLVQGRKLVMVDAEDERLTDGFHKFEVDEAIRWTDGDAVLPTELFDRFDGHMRVELTVAHATQYVAMDMAA